METVGSEPIGRCSEDEERPIWSPARLLFLLGIGMVFLPACDMDEMREPPSVFLVRGLEIDSIDLYQSVAIPLMANWKALENQSVPVLRGKDALLRISVKRAPGWRSRPVICKVDFQREDSDLQSLTLRQTIVGDTEEDNLDTSLNIELPGDYLADDLAYSVTLLEVEESGSESGSESLGEVKGARWPPIGFQQIETEAAGGPLRLTLVPIRYQADGSGRLPDLSPDQIELYKKFFSALYPVAEVDLVVSEPIDWIEEVQADGTGWDRLLNRVATERQERGALPDEYFHGLLAPAETFLSYCGMGCVFGLSPVSVRAEDTWARVSVGLGFRGLDSAVTMIHEVGHTHGREHAPCGLWGEPVDSLYPYRTGEIGVWGYDLQSGKLKHPLHTRDFMSYCRPFWVSDYTYNGLLEWMRQVSALSSFRSGHEESSAKTSWLWVSLGLDGTVSKGGELHLDSPPGGEPFPVELRGVGGVVVKRVEGVFVPYGHHLGGVVLIEKPGSDVWSVRLPNHKVLFLKDGVQ